MDEPQMKSLSSAIIAASGVVCFAAGAFVTHGDTQLTVMLAGAAIAVIGIVVWGFCVIRPNGRND